jgi:hypothetical protein
MRSMMNVDNYLMLLLEETKHQQYSKWREVPNGLKWTIFVALCRQRSVVG